jgi:arylsulfatase A-like enzyme
VRADEFSFAGNPIISTPHFDRIVREGATFRNAFVVNALCLPTRASVLTGMYSHLTGCIDNKDRALPADLPMFTDLLRTAGYEVAFFGKSHIKALSNRYWDYYFGIEAAGTRYYHSEIVESEKGNPKPPQLFEDYVDDVFTDRAVAWLNRERSKPFCLFLWFMAPHAPFHRPRRYLDLYNGVEIPKPSTFDDDYKGWPGKPSKFVKSDNKIGTGSLGWDNPRSLEEIVKNHYVGVVHNDDCARRLFEVLERQGIMDNTAIVLSSDHGFYLGEWRCYNKMFMHEPSIRVPLAVRYPPLIQAGRVSEKMALDLDIAPTILEMAGLKVPERMQGRSLLPLMQGREPGEWRKDWLYQYHDDRYAPRMRGLRTERYKFVHYFEPPEEFELYDLQADPGELNNLYGDPRYAELTQQLRERLRQLRLESGDKVEAPA